MKAGSIDLPGLAEPVVLLDELRARLIWRIEPVTGAARRCSFRCAARSCRTPTPASAQCHLGQRRRRGRKARRPAAGRARARRHADAGRRHARCAPPAARPGRRDAQLPGARCAAAPAEAGDIPRQRRPVGLPAVRRRVAGRVPRRDRGRGRPWPTCPACRLAPWRRAGVRVAVAADDAGERRDRLRPDGARVPQRTRGASSAST